jgi:hypothetical protein
MSVKTPGKHLTAFLVLLLLVMLPITFKSFGKNIEAVWGIKKTVKAQSNYSIFIDINENRLYLLKNCRQFKTYICATGTDETPSPIGYFKIIKKSRWGEGFGGYYLGLNCPWGTYGIHGTTMPDSVGFDSSHGCFRMFNSDIEELYGYVGVDTPIFITGGCYGVFGSNMRSIGPGMYGSDVMAVQKRLKQLGYYSGRCNGVYETAGFVTAVHKYQTGAGLPVSDYINKKMFAALGFVVME